MRALRFSTRISGYDNLMQPDRNIDAHLLGKIVLARFLELPVRTFHRMVRETETSIGKIGLDPWVSIGQLAGARVAHDVVDIVPNHTIEPLGRICVACGCPELLYHRESYAREYRFDEEGIQHLMSRPDFSRGQAGVLRKLRLINTRNRLTHALLQAVLTAQAAYLRTGEPLTLVALTQTMVSARLRSDPTLSVVADAGRVSRLVRGLSVTLPSGRVMSLNELFPKPRQVHRCLVECLIREEKSRMLEGELQAPLSDKDIVDILKREYGARLLRRTVASIRQELAIPDYRSRRERMSYLAATEGFSALVPLTLQTLRSVVPPRPGIYEIRTTGTAPSPEHMVGWLGKGTQLGRPGVIYIGSTGDLRKRLRDHLRGHSDNHLLCDRMANGLVQVRFCVVGEAWRAAERKLYEVFCETFGAPPPCNRMRP
jgi:RNA polymerase sigma-54 factor